jgi:hypothetical protein
MNCPASKMGKGTQLEGENRIYALFPTGKTDSKQVFLFSQCVSE